MPEMQFTADRSTLGWGEDILYLSFENWSAGIYPQSPVTHRSCLTSEAIGAKLSAYATLTADLGACVKRAAEREIEQGQYRGPLHGNSLRRKRPARRKGYSTSWGRGRSRIRSSATTRSDQERFSRRSDPDTARLEVEWPVGWAYRSLRSITEPEEPWIRVAELGSSSGSGASPRRTRSLCGSGTENWARCVPRRSVACRGCGRTYAG